MELTRPETEKVLEALRYLKNEGLIYIPDTDLVECFLVDKTKVRPSDRYGSYQAYLQSYEWQKLREAALEHHGRECQICGGHHDLQVHHVSYNDGTLAKVEDLAVLCRDCHNKLHKALDDIKIYNKTLRDTTRVEMAKRIADAINKAFGAIEGRRKQQAVSIVRYTWHNLAENYRLPDCYETIIQNVKKK